MGFGLDDAWPGDEEQPAGAHLDRPDFERLAHTGDFSGRRLGGPAVLLRRAAASTGSGPAAIFFRDILALFGLHSREEFGASSLLAHCVRIQTQEESNPGKFKPRKIKLPHGYVMFRSIAVPPARAIAVFSLQSLGIRTGCSCARTAPHRASFG